MKSRQGYTLIELVVVAGILGIIGVVSVGLFLSTILGGGKSTALNDVRSNGDYAITQMERMIRGARQIVGTCEADMTSLEIKNSDGGSTIFTSIDSRIASNSGYLTSDDILLATGGNLIFNCVSSSSKSPEIVTIEFTLQKGDPASPNRDYAQADFSTTVQIRSY
jgi:prepilin-type N-terminal cleavage/methylation domain-containing protein